MQQMTLTCMRNIGCRICKSISTGRGRRPKQLQALPFLAVLVLVGCSPVSTEPQAEVAADYVQGDDQFKVAISTDQLAVIVRDGVNAKRASASLGEHGLQLLRQITDNLLIFSVEEASSRSQITVLARAIRLSQQEFVQNAGLVMRFPEGDSPWVITDDIIIQFGREVTEEEIKETLLRMRLDILMPNPYVDNQFLLRLSSDSSLDALEVANALNESDQVEYAHPDFYRVIEERQVIPNDTYFGFQWHLNNTGQGAGTVDADIDAPEAWTISLGNANNNVIIAVIDSGFDATHPDLTPNFWVNGGEVAGDGVDNDGNGQIDDINGWDFQPCGAAPAAGCGDNTLAGGNHGTAVAGAAAAIGNNATGVSGSCPQCQMMLIRRGGGAANEFQHSLAFGYAQQMGAHIITNSWGYAIGPATPNVVAAINAAATNGRGGLGSVVLFAMNNPNVNDCGAAPDISSIQNVIAVSRSTNQDQFDFSGFGDCMDVLSTSTTSPQPATARGTLQGMTTDVQGAGGYNTAGGAACLSGNDPATPPATALDYTYCFDGTSFATPVAAGIAGLVLSLDATPTRQQVQQLLQDTADKTEHSLANYDTETGFSNGANAAVVATHGYGRVNAWEAVRIAGPGANGGLDGVDVFLRDNALDWGNTEQRSNVTFEPTRGFLGHWRSVDIKIDAPGYQTPPVTSADFAALADEQPQVGQMNRVYVRVRNRGFNEANDVKVKLLWTQFGTALPNFPDATIWTDFTDISTAVGDWNQLGVRSQATLGYSGASVANTINDQATIMRFDNFSPTFDASKPNHFCLFAVATSTEDPVASTTLIPDEATPTDNNVTHRNVSVDPSSIDRSERGFYVRNPFDRAMEMVVGVEVPEGWKVSLSEPFNVGKPFMMEPRSAKLVELTVHGASQDASGDVSITQYRLERRERIPVGGAVFRYQSKEDRWREQPLLWLEAHYLSLYKLSRLSTDEDRE